MKVFLMNALAWIAEQRIQDAAARGEFDELPGRGKPLVLEDDSHIPPDLRMAYKLLHNAGYLPPEVADRKEAQNILELLEHCTDEQEKVRQMRRLDIVLARIERGRGRPMTLAESGVYYRKVVERIPLPDSRGSENEE